MVGHLGIACLSWSLAFVRSGCGRGKPRWTSRSSSISCSHSGGPPSRSNFAVSLDGFGTGEGQSLDAPFGHAQTRLLEWAFDTRTFHEMHGEPGGATGVDEALASTWGPGIGAEIMGRNKFGPQRGPWVDQDWKGWWGENPPFHTPAFVLTHHPRPSIEMDGGTTFHFIEASPADALAGARAAANGLEVRIGGGPSTIREFLAADLIDHSHIALVPIVLGRGERLWDGLEGLALHRRRHEQDHAEDRLLLSLDRLTRRSRAVNFLLTIAGLSRLA